VSDVEIVVYIFIAIVAAVSYKIGHKKGILHAVDYLEKEGVLEFTDQEKDNV